MQNVNKLRNNKRLKENVTKIYKINYEMNLKSIYSIRESCMLKLLARVFDITGVKIVYLAYEESRYQ